MQEMHQVATMSSIDTKCTLNRRQKRSEDEGINWVLVEECSTMSVPFQKSS